MDLLFDRDASELGQLGHPPTLEAPALEAQSAGGTSGSGAGVPAPGREPAKA